jgi:glycosyltransferase 2 family protein
VIINKHLLRTIKIAVSLGLLTLLSSLVDWEGAQAGIRDIPLMLVVLVIAIFGLQFAVSAWKWHASLRACKVTIPFVFLLRTYCIAFFFGNFLPSNVGGDVYRAYRTSAFCSRGVATLGVIMERIFGLVALILVGLYGVLWLLMTSNHIASTTLVASLVGVTAGYFVAPLIFLYGINFYRGWHKWLPERMKPLIYRIDDLMANKVCLLELLGICVLYQLIAVIPFGLLFVTIGSSWLLAESAVANVAGSLAAIVPISINGFGITEASFIGVASQLGADLTVATIVSFLIRILVLPLVAVFGIMYMFQGEVHPTKPVSKLQAEAI